MPSVTPPPAPTPSRATLEPDAARVPARVWSGTALQVGVRVLTTLTTFAGLALLARGLPGVEFGRLTFYLAALLFLEAWVDAGPSTAALQRAAGNEEELGRCVRAARRLRAGAAGLGTLALTSYALLVPEPEWTFVACAGALSFSRCLEASSLWFHARIAWRVPTRVRAVVAVARLSAVLWLWSLGARTFGPFLLAHAALGAAGNVALFLLARDHLPRAGRTAPGFARAALSLAVLGIAQQSYFYADNLVVRSLEGDASLGHYNAAVRVFGLLVMVAGLATNTALPWLARQAERTSLQRAAVRLGAPLFLGTLVVVLPVFPFAEELLRSLFGARFAVATSSLQFLLGAALLVSLGSAFLTAVIAAGRVRSAVGIALGGLVLNLVGNLRLVPELGIEGAAIATLATELFVGLASACVLFSLPPGAKAAARRPHDR